MITERDIAFFQTFGYVILRQYLDPAEVDQMTSEVMSAMNEAYAATPFDGTKPHHLPLTSSRQPFMQSLLEDPRFYEAAQQLSGVDDLIALTVDANRYVGDTAWHSDGGRALLGVKFVAYLEQLSADTGALRVIPGSHREPSLSQVQAFIDANRDELAIEDLPAVPCESVPGDIVVFNYPTFHAALGGSNDRRMCTIEYLEYPQDVGQKERMLDCITGIFRGTAESFPHEGYPWYDEDWLANPSGNPVRQRLIDRMETVGVFEIPGARGS